MRILASHDGLGCGYVRVLQPLRELAKHGHDIKFTTTKDTEASNRLGDAHTYDVIIGQRFAGYDGMRLWRRARTPQNRLVYETDDNLFDLDMANWAAYVQFNKGDIREAITGYTTTADLVTTTTETLAEIQRELGAEKVAVLPNCVPEYLLDMPRTERKRPRIGWIGGASHGVDIHEAVPAVRRFLNKNDGWDLFVGGTDYRPSFNCRNWDQMSYGEWRQINEDEHAYYELVDFDIGLAPVRDTKFSRSKSALKALEYNARGIPVIASDVQPYREYVQHGYNGFLAKTEHDWMKYIRLLAEDSDLREQMGKNGRFEAGKHTLENNWQRWEQAYEELF